MRLQRRDDEERILPVSAVFVVFGFYRFFDGIGTVVHGGCMVFISCAGTLQVYT